MFTLVPSNTYEKYLCDRAYETDTPLSGTFELLPVCNMDCRMCYVRTTPEEMRRQGRMWETEEYLRVGKEAAEAGCLFLLLTGGEPLLYPGFAGLYRGLRALGIVITLNTNGTLITPEVIRLLRNAPPRRVNVSLYGASNDTYANLCGNPKGFTQTIDGIRNLADAGIAVKVNFTATPQNAGDLDSVIRITEEMGIPISTPTYMFPPVRKPDGCRPITVNRLTPEEAAYYQFDITCRAHAEDPDFKDYIAGFLNDIAPGTSEDCQAEPPAGFLCSAGHSSFWVNWKGMLSGCGMLEHPAVSLGEHSFADAWKELRRQLGGLTSSKECFNCRFRPVCKSCVAASFAESGDTSEPPRYHCRLNAHYELLMKKHLARMEVGDTNTNL